MIGQHGPIRDLPLFAYPIRGLPTSSTSTRERPQRFAPSRIMIFNCCNHLSDHTCMPYREIKSTSSPDVKKKFIYYMYSLLIARDRHQVDEKLKEMDPYSSLDSFFASLPFQNCKKVRKAADALYNKSKNKYERFFSAERWTAPNAPPPLPPPRRRRSTKELALDRKISIKRVMAQSEFKVAKSFNETSAGTKRARAMKATTIEGMVVHSMRVYYMIQCIQSLVRAYRRLSRVIISRRDILLYEIEVYAFYKNMPRFWQKELFYVHAIKFYAPQHMEANFALFEHVRVTEFNVRFEGPMTYGHGVFDLNPNEKVNHIVKTDVARHTNNRFGTSKNALTQCMTKNRRTIEVSSFENVSKKQTYTEKKERMRLTIRKRKLNNMRFELSRNNVPYARGIGILLPGEHEEIMKTR